MLFILKTVRDKPILGKFWTHLDTKVYLMGTSEKFRIFQILAAVFEFWEKWKMLFILKTIREPFQASLATLAIKDNFFRTSENFGLF